MRDCLTVAFMFVCNGIGIYVAHKLFTWFEGQPAKYGSKKTYLQNVRKASRTFPGLLGLVLTKLLHY